MTNISISNLNPVGSQLFVDDESFMTELSESELDGINGGYGGDTYCGNGRVTLPTTLPTTSPLVRVDNTNVVVQPAVAGNLVIGL